MILQAFVDDSGSEPQSQRFVLGGLVSVPDLWARFSDDWQDELDRSPTLPYFKMSEAHSQRGAFEGWTSDAAHERTMRFAKIIREYVAQTIVISIKHEDFQAQIENIRLPERHLATDKPYFTLFSQLILMMAEFQRKYGFETTCDFVFDEQSGYSDDALLWWPAIVSLTEELGLKKYLGDRPIFRPDSKFLPLQGADLYAWHMRRYFDGHDEGILKPVPVLEEIIHIGSPPAWQEIRGDQLASIRKTLLEGQARFAAEHPHIPLLEAGKRARFRSRKSRFSDGGR
jgi:hypothetical protein